MLQPVMTVPSAGLERGADLEVRERGVGVLARAARGGDQIDLARRDRAARRGPSRRSAPPRRSPSGAARRSSMPAIEAGAAIGFDARAAIVEQQPRRIRPADAVDDVGDARDLIQPAPSAPALRDRAWQRSAAAASVQWRTA